MTASEAPEKIQRSVPLAPLTSLGLGGAASFFSEVGTVDEAVDIVRWSRRQQSPLAVLGGGTNLVVSDAGWNGVVLRVALQGIDFGSEDGSVLVTAAAGETWDELVEMTVSEGLSGLECLSGIPGSVGATPIQNVGAYGQEVASVIGNVKVLDLENFKTRDLRPSECGFGYRSSEFRQLPGRFLVLAVTFRLTKGGAATVAYRELREALAASESTPSLAEVREAVLHLRQGKSMVIDENDPNRRSVGSFFINPVVDPIELEVVQLRARMAGIIADNESVPSFEIEGGDFKLSAGWLVEQAGFEKGLRRGSVGISTAHALALVHHGGGSATELVELAREIRGGVFATFGVDLQPEPVFLGFEGGVAL